MDLTARLDAELARIRRMSGDQPELLPDRLAQACVSIMPATAAGVSVFSTDGFRFPAGASDLTASVAERLQFTLGDGPCLDAHATGEPVEATEQTMARRWPEFHLQLVTRTPYRAIVSLPMSGYPDGMGCVDLYFVDDAAVDALDRDAAGAAVRHIRTLLVGDDVDVEPVWVDSTVDAPRNRVMTAIGMLNVALGVTAEQALAVLRAHAFSEDTTIDDIAARLVRRELSPSALDPSSDS